MFTSSEINEALVAERQDHLLHEARRAKLGRRARRSRRARHITLPWLGDVGGPPPSSTSVRESLFG